MKYITNYIRTHLLYFVIRTRQLTTFGRTDPFLFHRCLFLLGCGGGLLTITFIYIFNGRRGGYALASDSRNNRTKETYHTRQRRSVW